MIYRLSFYSFPNIICSFILLLLGIFVFIKNKSLPSNRLFALFTLSSFTWLFMYGVSYFFLNETFAGTWLKIGYSGVLFIPSTIYHFIITILRQKEKTKEKVFIRLFYLVSIICFIYLWSGEYFIKESYYHYFWGYYPKASLLHPVYLIVVSIIPIRVLILLYFAIKREVLSINRQRLKYLFVASILFALSGLDFIQNYGIEFYPMGWIFALFFALTTAYAIIKYQLLDIKVALTRAGIFVVVYTLVLGIPFWLGYVTKAWFPATTLAVVLATTGPFIYIYLDRRSEERLLKEQKRYQDTLKQASVGMTRIRDLNKLLNLIVHIVTKTVRITYAGIYQYDQEKEVYLLKVKRGRFLNPQEKLTLDNPLIKWLLLKQKPLIYEEIKQRMQETKENYYRYLEENMRQLGAAVIIPSFLEEKLIGFIVLGDKISGQIYSPEDLNVFEVLANQAALAIENAQFYEEAKKMHAQIAQTEKMATIGTMADGLSHQINNRFHALGLIAADTIDTIKMTDISGCSPQIKEMLNQINHALERIQANVLQGSEVVKGILKYSRTSQEGFEALDLNTLLNNTLEMLQYKIKLSEIEILRDFGDNLPKIKGNSVQLQEVFFNLIDNAYDAILERKQLLKEEGYLGRIIISAKPKNKNLEIIIEDNGIGIKEEDRKKLFTPFFTTKVSSRKGTGLGLYVVNRIITDQHQGKINFESNYKVGSRFILELPTAG